MLRNCWIARSHSRTLGPMTWWNFGTKWQCIEPTKQLFFLLMWTLYFMYIIPQMFHGDEGVGHRRNAVMPILFRSLLWVGKSSLERMLLITSCPHKMYSKFNKGSVVGNVVLDKFMEECGRSALKSHTQGIATHGHTFYLIFVRIATEHHLKQSTRGHLKTNICPHGHANTYSAPFSAFGCFCTFWCWGCIPKPQRTSSTRFSKLVGLEGEHVRDMKQGTRENKAKQVLSKHDMQSIGLQSSDHMVYRVSFNNTLGQWVGIFEYALNGLVGLN